MKRRNVLALGLALPFPALPADAAPSPALPAGVAAGSAAFDRRFARPGAGTAAKFRWWWPHGLVDPAVFGIATRQTYGLIGPVRVIPYREKEIGR